MIGFVLSLVVMACAPSETIETQSPAPIQSENKAPKSASVVTLRKNPSDGQFWTQARVNTGSVRFLVDTGAGMVALTEMDAKKAGIKTRDLVYDLPIRTAGGDNMAARIVLDRISVGAITIKDVDAIVVPTGLDVSLLGMTYLGELQFVQASPTVMTLRF
ncbi:retropepsin-like aspartic protease family protein [Litorimonas sp.]|uniref:retropepsin-like aspartic protease family protein n=1 Tax=Litorimonas sp. TaxID=1892381 RepID=UPI003A8AA1D7